MKKINTVFIAALIILASCSKEKNEPEPNPINPEKKIIKTEAILTPFKFGVSSPSLKFTYASWDYNSEGQLTEVNTRSGNNTFDKSDSWLEPTYFKYENNKMVERKEISFRYTYT